MTGVWVLALRNKRTELIIKFYKNGNKYETLRIK